MSNESDPGVLLLKLNALIADKNNYNIDKNILECFPSSVTQYGNARKIYDSLGYKMGWYKSATTQVGFQLKNTTGLTENEPVLIDLFTQLTDDTKEVSYVTLQGALLSLKQSNNVVKVDVIEGTVQNYEVNGSTEITLSNLDDNLRLYFNESRIAENGIYIKSNIDADWFSWKKVDNIITYPLESKVFEFGVLPNSDTCYIQFPTDINTLVSSFEIKFIISNGVNGNIKSNILNQFVNNISYGEGNSAIVVNDKIKITQQYGTTNGADIETLDQAYSNYKKTIGTFNTLVTAKDYESAIYNLKDDDKYLISNVIVSDRSNDINTSVRVAEWTLKNQSNVLYTLKTDSNSSSPRFGVSDICLYLLKSSSNLNNANDYNATFSMNLGENISSIRNSIIEQLEDIKSLQHNYIYPEDLSDELVLKHIYGIFLNLYKLDGQFITYQKVTREEKIEIESNVKIALYKNYNARNLNFGNDIDYYDLIDVIKGADARIKDVILNIPEISTYSNHTKADTSGTYEIRPLSYDEKIDLIAKMILSGNVQLFNFDSFDYDFGQRNVKKLDGINAGVTDSSIKSISTNFNFNLEPSSVDVVEGAVLLQENQSVQFCTPNYVTVRTFSSWVKYTYNGTSPIPKDTMYKLGVGEYITITYTDAAGVQQPDKIENSYIQSNVDLKPNEPTMLLAGQQIDEKALNKQELIVGTKYYFITKSKSLTIGPNSSYMLQEGEYFIYTNQVNDEFVLLGSGTLIENNSVSETFEKVIDDSDESMLDDVSSISWIQLNVPLTLVEMQVTTLSAGVQLKSDKEISTNSYGVTLPTNAGDSATIRA